MLRSRKPDTVERNTMLTKKLACESFGDDTLPILGLRKVLDV
jgi:hypothetical protein